MRLMCRVPNFVPSVSWASASVVQAETQVCQMVEDLLWQAVCVKRSFPTPPFACTTPEQEPPNVKAKEEACMPLEMPESEPEEACSGLSDMVDPSDQHGLRANMRKSLKPGKPRKSTLKRGRSMRKRASLKRGSSKLRNRTSPCKAAKHTKGSEPSSASGYVGPNATFKMKRKDPSDHEAEEHPPARRKVGRKPVDAGAASLDDEAKSAVKKPKIAAKKPKSAAKKPKSAPKKPKSAPKKPKSAPKKPKSAPKKPNNHVAKKPAKGGAKAAPHPNAKVKEYLVDEETGVVLGCSSCRFGLPGCTACRKASFKGKRRNQITYAMLKACQPGGKKPEPTPKRKGKKVPVPEPSPEPEDWCHEGEEEEAQDDDEMED